MRAYMSESQLLWGFIFLRVARRATVAQGQAAQARGAGCGRQQRQQRDAQHAGADAHGDGEGRIVERCRVVGGQVGRRQQGREIGRGGNEERGLPGAGAHGAERYEEQAHDHGKAREAFQAGAGQQGEIGHGGQGGGQHGAPQETPGAEPGRRRRGATAAAR